MGAPWTDADAADAQRVVSDPSTKPEIKAAVEAKLREYESLKSQASSDIVPGQNQSAAAPPGVTEETRAARALRARNRPMLQKPVDPNARPSAARPLEGGELDPVVYLEDGSAGEAENNRRYAEIFDEAQRNGQTVYRARDMGDDWTSQLMRGAAHLRGSLASAGIGAARGGSAGIVDLEAEEPRAREITGQYPLSSLLGNLGGAAAGLPARMAAALGSPTPAASAGGRILQGANSGAKAATLQSGIELGKGAGNGEDPGAIARRIALTIGMGVGTGGLVGGLGAAGAAAKKSIEQGKSGLDIRRLAAEMDDEPTSVLGGVKKPPSVQAALDDQLATGKRGETLAARQAVPEAQKTMGEQMASTRGRISADKEAYRSSPEGMERKSAEPLMQRMQDILKRDEADGGQLPFESSSKLRGELKKLLRGTDEADEGASAMVDAEGHVTMGRPAQLNARELDRVIRNIDEAGKAGAQTSTPGTREIGELGAVARGIRDEFGPNAVAPQGYSAMRSGHAQAIGDLENKLTSLGLPKALKDIDPGDLEQTDKVYQALIQYGSAGNELRDQLVDELAKANPALAKSLRDKLVMDSYRRLAGEEVGTTLGAGGLHSYLKPAAIRSRLHAAGTQANKANPARSAATINPILGPLEGLFQRKPEEKRP